MYKLFALAFVIAFMVIPQAQADDDWWEDMKLSQASETPKEPQKIEPQLLSTQVKLTMEQAEELAQKQAPGKTTEIELERNKDGKLIYEVEITTKLNEQTQVQIDALTGRVVKVQCEPLEQQKKKNELNKSQKSEGAGQ